MLTTNSLLLKSSHAAVGKRLVNWYLVFGRDLPFRKTKEPYKIWICEIVFQQTRIEQGLNHYQNFIKRFPDVQSLAEADLDEVLLYWKGLGYYSRAMNVHKAAQQIMIDFGGKFPKDYQDILRLKGVGKYTAAAISSICFDVDLPAVDGNFYRVLSRFFADDFDISQSKAFDYFSELSLRILPKNQGGLFNQAMMDLGSEICKPKNPLCEQCPLQKDCLANQFHQTSQFPKKLKKTKVENLELTYYFIVHQTDFLIHKRGTDFIWKNLYDFPSQVDEHYINQVERTTEIHHKLSHKNLKITIHQISIENLSEFLELAHKTSSQIISFQESSKKSFPKPLQIFIEKEAGIDKR